MSILSFLKANPKHESKEAFQEFQKFTFRAILFFLGGACLAWQLCVFAMRPEDLLGYNGLILLLVGATSGAAIWLLEKSPAASVSVWSAGVSIAVGILIAAYRLPIIGIFYLLAPLIAFTLFGGLTGLVILCLSTVGMLLLGSMFSVVILPVENILPLAIGAVVFSAVGWTVRHSLRETIGIYWENYEQATMGIEEARQQRLELKQTQEDLTLVNRELTRLTKQLDVLKQAAEEARRAKENFVAAVSHELRTPLNMIIGFSEVISESPQTYGTHLPPALLADIGSIRRNSQHLLELVNDVLDLSQIDTGNMAISREWCSLRQIVEEALDVIRPLFESKELFLEAKIPGEDPRLYCDSTRIREVMINILSNAGRFTKSGGVTLTASIHEYDLVIAIRDTGPGISAEDQKKLFEPFHQLGDSFRHKHEGSGLGLAISKRFVELHGGRMWLESTIDVGTTVYFSLPLPTPEPDLGMEAGAARWISPYQIFTPRSRLLKVPIQAPVPRCLVLEEGNMVKKIFERYLGDIDVDPVTDIGLAMSDLSLSPAQLLVINHRQAAKILNSIHSPDQLPFRMPAIGFWLPGTKDYADELGVHTYLIKPVPKEVLIDVLLKLGPDIRSVLVVDDDPEVLQLLGRILTSTERKYRVWRASNGEQALEVLRKRKPDVMILDQIMPEMNGVQVLKEKDRDPSIRNIPVIMITAQDPLGMSKVSDAISISRGGGFSVGDLLDLVRFLGLNPEFKPEHG